MGFNTRAWGKLAVVHEPITPLPSPTIQLLGISIAIDVTFLSARSSLSADCVIPPGKPPPSPAPSEASSHREAPNISRFPTLDSTDFYVFNSYEQGRDDYVTLIANYIPLQDAYGGPNYFAMDPDATYSIHIDNDGDAVEDITFAFNFKSMLPNDNQGVQLTVGPEGNQPNHNTGRGNTFNTLV